MSEYTHIEAERVFITFDDLLDSIESLITDVIARVLADPVGKELLFFFNPDFKQPKKPFKRMNYTDAIEYLKENNITKEDGTAFEFGDDIPEMPERKMTDQINEVGGILGEHFCIQLLNFFHSRNFSPSCCAASRLRSSPSTCLAVRRTSD